MAFQHQRQVPWGIFDSLQGVSPLGFFLRNQISGVWDPTVWLLLICLAEIAAKCLKLRASFLARTAKIVVLLTQRNSQRPFCECYTTPKISHTIRSGSGPLGAIPVTAGVLGSDAQCGPLAARAGLAPWISVQNPVHHWKPGPPWPVWGDQEESVVAHSSNHNKETNKQTRKFCPLAKTEQLLFNHN